MNFFDYIGKTQDEFAREYLDTRLVNAQSHNKFPLVIYSYGRKAVFDNVWDNVTSKCRGIIVRTDTWEVIARPFEKFHNLGSEHAPEPPSGEPAVMEKVDGFMCTLYKWQGKQYIASKGSFHSIHAKWATSWLRQRFGDNGFYIPDGYTGVFEGLHKDLRIVVDYGDRQGLVLLAVIHNATGVELYPYYVEYYAKLNGIECAKQYDLTLDRAREESLTEYRDGLGTEEGYVATWYCLGGYKPPVRLKIKFIDYLRLHRMVCGVSPHHIWEAMSQDRSEIAEWLDKNNSTPWFTAYVSKWKKAIQAEFNRVSTEATEIFFNTVEKLGVEPCVRNRQELTPTELAVRKAFAQEFTKPENKKYSAALFKLLDNQDPTGAYWKYVEPMTKGVAPLRDAQFS